MEPSKPLANPVDPILPHCGSSTVAGRGWGMQPCSKAAPQVAC